MTSNDELLSTTSADLSALRARLNPQWEAARLEAEADRADRRFAHLDDADLRTLFALPDVDGRHAEAHAEQLRRRGIQTTDKES